MGFRVHSTVTTARLAVRRTCREQVPTQYLLGETRLPARSESPAPPFETQPSNLNLRLKFLQSPHRMGPGDNRTLEGEEHKRPASLDLGSSLSKKAPRSPHGASRQARFLS